MILGCGQAIYPVLIIVIVALNRSPIVHGFVDSMHLLPEGGGNHSPMYHIGFDRATIATAVINDATPIVRDNQDRASEAEAKQASLDTRFRARSSESSLDADRHGCTGARFADL